MSEMNLQMFFPPTKITEPKIEPVKKTPKFKYVKAFYNVRQYSMWKVPAYWDDKKISVKWDDLYYGDGENKSTIATKKVERKCVDDYDYKYPDDAGKESPLIVYTKKELEDDEGYKTCEDE